MKWYKAGCYFSPVYNSWTNSGSLSLGQVVLDDMIPRPTTKQWDGEGLPPVGCECEAYDHQEQQWVFGRMAMHGNSDHLFACGTPERWGKAFWACKFRPIKSAAERERDELTETVRKAYLDGAMGHVGGLEAITEAILSKYELRKREG